MAPDVTAETRTRLELEIAVESIQVFLALYLLTVILLVFVPALAALRDHQGRFGVAEGWELGSALYLSLRRGQAHP